jgi:hypothetical protein
VILLAGPFGCGKTTIIVGLYELFNQGPVGGLLFGGSETLAAFERICHPGRVPSGLRSPKTIRTNPSSGVTFFHVRVGEERDESVEIASVLISEVSGEAFDEARDQSEPTMVTRVLWRRADMICVIMDGEKLAAPTKRHSVRAYAKSLLRAVREAGHVSAGCRLALVTTKWDLITSSEAEDFVEETELLLGQLYGLDFKAVSCHRIAARQPPVESLTRTVCPNCCESGRLAMRLGPR